MKVLLGGKRGDCRCVVAEELWLTSLHHVTFYCIFCYLVLFVAPLLIPLQIYIPFQASCFTLPGSDEDIMAMYASYLNPVTQGAGIQPAGRPHTLLATWAATDSSNDGTGGTRVFFYSNYRRRRGAAVG